MLEQQKKLELFKKSIMEESTKDVERIVTDLATSRKLAILKVRRQLSEEAAGYLESRSDEISAREKLRVNAHRNKLRHELLQYREECAKEVFRIAQEHIARFTESDAYPAHMAGLLARAIGEIGYGFTADVYLRPEDMGLADYLLGSVSGVSLGFGEGTFILGGLRLASPAKARRVDLSFDTALTDLIGHFSDMAGIYLGDD